jgi:hypothetical protein
MEYHSPEQSRQVVAEASKVAERIEKQCANDPREVVFTALQMLLPLYAANMGMTFDELMSSLAMNMPTFQNNLAAAVGGNRIDTSEIKKEH